MYNRNGRKVGFIGVVALAGVALPAVGFGYGVEIPENGTVPFGRAGAYVARASDPSAVAHNMAGVMGLGGFQIMLSSNVGFFTHCFQRSGTYDGPPDVGVNYNGTRFARPGGAEPAYFGQPYPEVCKEPSVGLAPQLLATYRVNRWLAFGAGLTTPSTQGSGQNFPDTVQLPNGMSAPSPARYLLFRKSLLVLYPTIGVAVQPHPRLRFGLTIQPSFASFGFGLMANAVRTAPQSPESDILIQLSAQGFFLAGGLSTQILINRFLSFGAQVHYNMPVIASGHATTTANYYAANAANQYNGGFEINRMEVNLPWNARAGVRFALPRTGRPTQDDGSGRYDPMTDDVFDVEADFNFERTSMLGTTALQNSGNIAVGVGSEVPAPRAITINSALADVYGVRLGGDYNILPGRLAARLGFSYETQGASPDAAQIHLPAYAGASIHAGVSFRWRWLTINAGFGQFFFQSNDASNGRRAIVTPSDMMGNQINPAACPEAPDQGRGTCTINQGVYRASFTAGSLGFVGRF